MFDFVLDEWEGNLQLSPLNSWNYNYDKVEEERRVGGDRGGGWGEAEKLQSKVNVGGGWLAGMRGLPWQSDLDSGASSCL